MAKRKSKVGRKKINPMDKKEQVSFYIAKRELERHGGKPVFIHKCKKLAASDNID